MAALMILLELIVTIPAGAVGWVYLIRQTRH